MSMGMVVVLMGTGVGCFSAMPVERTSPQRLKISVVFDVGGRGDHGFNDMAFIGVEKAMKELDGKLLVNTFQGSEAGDNRELLLRLQGQDKVDLVIAVGYIFSEPIKKIAPQFPATKFAIIDGNVPGLNPTDNIICLLFREQEGSFLVGAAAALKSKTGKIGFVGGMVSPLIKKFEIGYISGARHINPQIDVATDYIGTTITAYMDPLSAHKLAVRQFDAGADIIFHAAGGSGIGVLQAAQEKEKLMIGVDMDQSLTFPAAQRKYILTSMVKRVDTAVYATILKAFERKLEGGYFEFGLQENGVSYAENPYNAEMLASIKEKMEELKLGIINKTVMIPE